MGLWFNQSIMRIFNKFRGTNGWISTWERVIRFRDMITQEAQRRATILTFWSKHGTEAAKEAFNVSRSTLFRWKQALQRSTGKLEGLNKKSTAPGCRRKRNIPRIVEEYIIKSRIEHPRLSKDKIAVLMRADGIASLSASTVGRILNDLKTSGRLPTGKHLSLSARTGKLIERGYKPQRKKLRRPKGYRVLEVDTVIRFIDGVKRYILTATDTEKRTAFAACYTNHSSASSADFLRKCVSVLPDCPCALQTDNGSEFGLHFSKAVDEYRLTHFHTYPRSPKMNSNVERFNRSIDEEFLRSHRALLRDNVAEFNRQLIDWLLWYNTKRPHWSLGLLSPFQYISRQLPAAESQMWWTDT